jgi:NAD(P)-dependent dehydrogenase (short-subunit alcohol dehydrogenase family)
MKTRRLPLFPLAQGLDRFGLPSDVANVVALLASARVECTTGQVLSVNGGRDMAD